MLDIAIRAAREAGNVLAEMYGRPHQIGVKGLRDIRTEADLAAEEVALRIIREGCPGACIVSEESNSTWQDCGEQPTWYVDPLDGTTNFARGLPMFSVSVAMARHGMPVCGVILDPLVDQLFCAERGQGAYLNGRRLHVSARHELKDSLVTLDWPRAQALREQCARFLARLAPQTDAVRSRGTSALGLCGIAAGWADVYFQYTLSPWDVAAGILLVEEAGGQVTDLLGQPYVLNQPSWLATNGLLHETILAAGPYE
jgi:myo-inositol-1(or 4)-monophosphatase